MMEDSREVRGEWRVLLDPVRGRKLDLRRCCVSGTEIPPALVIGSRSTSAIWGTRAIDGNETEGTIWCKAFNEKVDETRQVAVFSGFDSSRLQVVNEILNAKILNSQEEEILKIGEANLIVQNDDAMRPLYLGIANLKDLACCNRRRPQTSHKLCSSLRDRARISPLQIQINNMYTYSSLPLIEANITCTRGKMTRSWFSQCFDQKLKKIHDDAQV